MKKTVACIIARTVSNRLPLKILRKVYRDHCMLDFLIQRIKLCKNVDEIYICTSDDPVDDIMEDIAMINEVKVYRGSKNKVISRMIDVGKMTKADNLIRITGDNVFTSYEYIDDQINLLNKNDLDYVRIINVPLGATSEVISRSALENCYTLMDPDISEYLTLFIFNPDNYNCGVMTISNEDWSKYTLTVDYAVDLERTKAIIRSSKEKNKLKITLLEIIELIEKDNKIPGVLIPTDGKIKLPYDQTSSYTDFMSDMKSRAIRSKKFTIDANEY